jgi:hypothetical protein
MKAGNSHLMEALTILGTGKVKYVHQITLLQRNGNRLRAKEAVPATSASSSTFMIYGKTMGSPNVAFAVPAEELVGLEIEWDSLPEGVTDIPSAIAHEKKARK